jgi:peptide/nickel transport system permease protein
MAVIMLVIFGLGLKWFPTSGGYGFDMVPHPSLKFVWSVIVHYQLPFWSIVLIAIGGWAIGMRSMSIYELNADYVKYSRFMGIKDRKIIQYVFRNGMLPQITGLALAIGTMVGGALVAEIIFSYPGLGTTLLSAIRGQDYPMISATTLIITVMVLIANFTLEILYGFIDPRIKAAQSD